jgi:hypothetical protein
MNEKVQITSQLVQAVRDSRLLLTYASQAGMTLDAQMLTILVNAQYRVDFNEWTNKDEAEFWQAFSRLNVLVKPVTLESLKAVSQVETKSYRFRFLRLLNKAYRTAMLYVILALLCMGILLVTQIYWLVGQKLSQELNSLKQDTQQLSLSDGSQSAEDNQKLMQIETTRTLLVLWSRLWNWSSVTDEDDEFAHSPGKENYEAEIAALQDALKLAVDRLNTFKDFNREAGGRELSDLYQKGVDDLTDQLIRKKTDYAKDQNDYLFTEVETKTRYVLHVLQRYILPLLYGALGAAAYVLRSLIQDIQDETYTGKSNMKYRVKLFLGALAGLVIGFFVIPEEMGALSTLPPLALSFLVGYNVEVLFLVMDRFIAMIMKKIRPAPSNK